MHAYWHTALTIPAVYSVHAYVNMHRISFITLEKQGQADCIALWDAVFNACRIFAYFTFLTQYIQGLKLVVQMLSRLNHLVSNQIELFMNWCISQTRVDMGSHVSVIAVVFSQVNHSCHSHVLKGNRESSFSQAWPLQIAFSVRTKIMKGFILF